MALLKMKFVVWRVALTGFLLLCGVRAAFAQPRANSAAPAPVKAKDFAGTSGLRR
jgi:hypothetical protein